MSTRSGGNRGATAAATVREGTTRRYAGGGSASKAMNAAPPVVTHVGIVSRSEESRAYGDRRFIVTREVHEYRDAEGHEYRVTFETRGGARPVVPTRGTMSELNAHREQWRAAAAAEGRKSASKAKHQPAGGNIIAAPAASRATRATAEKAQNSQRSLHAIDADITASLHAIGRATSRRDSRAQETRLKQFRRERERTVIALDKAGEGIPRPHGKAGSGSYRDLGRTPQAGQAVWYRDHFNRNLPARVDRVTTINGEHIAYLRLGSGREIHISLSRGDHDRLFDHQPRQVAYQQTPVKLYKVV